MQTTRPRNQSRLSRGIIAITWLIAAAIAIAVLLVAAQAAEGGTYGVVQCHPGHDAGHADLIFDRNSNHYTASSACLDGNGLTIHHEGRRSARDRWGEWSATVPDGTELRAIRAKVAGVEAAGHVPELYAGASARADTAFGRPTGAPHAVRWRGVGANGFTARLRCARARCGEGRAAKLVLRRIALRLVDSVAPDVEAAGPLAEPATRRGTQMLAPVVSDTGGGVRQVFVAVNDEPVAARPLACQLRHGIATRLQPCPRTAEPAFMLNTKAKPFRQGRNRLRVCAVDLATGRHRTSRNRDCVSRRVRVDNQCPVDDAAAAGTVNARLAGAGRRATIVHGRAARVVGRLTDASGEGIARAEVCVATRVEVSEAAERVVATPTTNADGRFEAHLDPGPTREVRVAHWAGPERVFESYLRLRVRSAPGLRLRPKRTLHNGERVHFAVRLHGPAPAGRRFHIKVRTSGDWQLLRTETTNRSGRWRGSYRFHATTGRRTYRFKAFVPAQSGYPFAGGSSPTRRAHVRG